MSYMYLAIALYHLEDPDNTRAAFERAVDLDSFVAEFIFCLPNAEAF
jgi:hypothetical protein